MIIEQGIYTITVFQCLSSVRGLRNPDVFRSLVSADLKGANSGCLHFGKITYVQIVNMKLFSIFIGFELHCLLSLHSILTTIITFRMFLSSKTLSSKPNVDLIYQKSLYQTSILC